MERVVQVLRRRLGCMPAFRQHVSEDIDRAEAFDLLPDLRPKEAVEKAVRYQSMQKAVVLLQVVLEVVVDHGAVVAPRVAGEELVAADAGQYDLDELAREARDVEVRIA